MYILFPLKYDTKKPPGEVLNAARVHELRAQLYRDIGLVTAACEEEQQAFRLRVPYGRIIDDSSSCESLSREEQLLWDYWYPYAADRSEWPFLFQRRNDTHQFIPEEVLVYWAELVRNGVFNGSDLMIRVTADKSEFALFAPLAYDACYLLARWTFIDSRALFSPEEVLTEVGISAERNLKRCLVARKRFRFVKDVSVYSPIWIFLIFALSSSVYLKIFGIMLLLVGFGLWRYFSSTERAHKQLVSNLETLIALYRDFEEEERIPVTTA